jgi:hypothetical protein
VTDGQTHQALLPSAAPAGDKDGEEEGLHGVSNVMKHAPAVDSNLKLQETTAL